MQIKEINNKEIWENFLLSCKEKTFLNSWNWGEFQNKIEDKIWRLGVYDNEQLVAVVLVVKIKARRGTFLFVPHGPVLSCRSTNKGAKLPACLAGRLLKELSSFVIKLAKQEKASFIRISPIWQRNKENIRIFKELGFREGPIHIHPELTWELDITPTEEELLMGMRKTTRYLIKQAQKNLDIEIIKSQNIEDLARFGDIYYATAKRHKFIPFSLDYLKKQFSCFLPDNILIFLGKYKKEVVCAAIVIYWQGIGFYHHGASLSKYNKVPVSYLLQWEAIKEAKKRACKIYNFWGIAPQEAKKHPWYGLTLFKMGFGGCRKEYIKTQDLLLSPKYWLTYIFERVRRVKRGL